MKTIDEWLNTAPDWAMVPLQDYYALKMFSRGVRSTNHWVTIDPRRIVGAARRDLQGVSVYKILKNRMVRFNQFQWDFWHRDPSALANPWEFIKDASDEAKDEYKAQWCLARIGDDYFVSEGHHRSIMAKILCNEGFIESLTVPTVLEIDFDHDAYAAYRLLKKIYPRKKIKIIRHAFGEAEQNIHFSWQTWFVWKCSMTTEQVLQRYGSSGNKAQKHG